jgi:hypothetical protein
LNTFRLGETSAEIKEAISRIQGHMDSHGIGYYPHIKLAEAFEMAIAALRRVEWENTLWHDAKSDPPKPPGLYYGKKDDTNSMYAVNYQDGMWTIDAYPDQKIEILQWADYAAF